MSLKSITQFYIHLMNHLRKKVTSRTQQTAEKLFNVKWTNASQVTISDLNRTWQMSTHDHYTEAHQAW